MAKKVFRSCNYFVTKMNFGINQALFNEILAKKRLLCKNQKILFDNCYCSVIKDDSKQQVGHRFSFFLNSK